MVARLCILGAVGLDGLDLWSRLGTGEMGQKGGDAGSVLEGVVLAFDFGVCGRIGALSSLTWLSSSVWLEVSCFLDSG